MSSTDLCLSEVEFSTVSLFCCDGDSIEREEGGELEDQEETVLESTGHLGGRGTNGFGLICKYYLCKCLSDNPGTRK